MLVGRFDGLENLPRRTLTGRRKRPKFLAVDFFCGAGGTTRGLIDAGGYVIAGIDKDASAKHTYVLNNGNESFDRAYPQFLEMDIFPAVEGYPNGQQREIREALDKLVIPVLEKNAEIPLLFAICAPCQPFTSVTRAQMTEKREKARERDRDLLIEAAHFVEIYKPDVVLSENVAGISDPKYGGIWTDFEYRLQQLGYLTGTKVVCASKFGIPQSRRRSILLAVRRDKMSDPNISSIKIPAEDVNATKISVKEALAGLPAITAGQTDEHVPNHRAAMLSDLNFKRLSIAVPGGNNRTLLHTKFGDISLKCHKKVTQRFDKSCFGDTYSRMDGDGISPTITTKCYSITNGRFGHYDVNQVRAISMREAAKLQSFPDNYIFYPKDKLQPVAKLIGNAVPPKLAQFYSKFSLELIG